MNNTLPKLDTMLASKLAHILAVNPFTALLCCVAIMAWVPWIINRWRFRHIPGPFAPPVLGNLLGLAQYDLHGYLELCRNKYGKIFKIYIGSNMIVCVAEPSTAKRAFSKLMFRHSGIQLVVGGEDWDLLIDGLVGANGAVWRLLRPAWQHAFNSAALESYAAAMNAGAEQLAETVLARAAASGEEVDLYQELGAMTLGVVGEAAYGVDLHSLSSPEQQQDQQLQGSALLEASKAVFQAGGVTSSSSYLPLVLLFPALAPLVQALAYRWPDAKLAKLAEARRKIKQVSMQLVHTWRGNPNSTAEDQQPPGAGLSSDPDPSASSEADAAAVPAGSGPAGTTAAAAGGSGKSKVGSEPGLFPKLMLDTRDKVTGQALTDEQVIAQFNSFMLAAFETSASTITTCIYYIAQHPEVEAQLLQEVDAFGSNRQVGYQDLEQFTYVDAIMKETLRLTAPGAIATRSTERPLQLTPQIQLPSQTPLFACIHCFQRDPDYWPLADEFRPDRWLQGGESLHPTTPDAYAPFGIGPRLCVGMRFANQEVATTLIRLYQQHRFELQPGQVPLPVKMTFALVPAQGLRVRVYSRNRSSTTAAGS